MKTNDQRMFDNGIAVVGDISNNQLSKSIKQNSKIYYHTFVELLGFDPAKAEIVFNKALNWNPVLHPCLHPGATSPSIPFPKDYLVCFVKYQKVIKTYCSMHNQESLAETDLFMNRSGDFIDFYKMLGLNLHFFEARFQSSIQSILPLFSAKQKTLLVHNTYTSLEDLTAVSASGNEIYWCFLSECQPLYRRQTAGYQSVSYWWQL